MSLIKEQTKRFKQLTVQSVIDKISNDHDWWGIMDVAENQLGVTQLTDEQQHKIGEEVQLLILKCLKHMLATKYH